MYNNPYNYYPYMNVSRGAFTGMNNFNQISGIANGVRPRGGLFRSLAGIKWGDVLNNTQKTLNVINQAIPVYYQIKPIFSNVKSFGRLLNAFNSGDDNDSSNTFNNNTNNLEPKKENSSNSPTFFIN
ncbi:MAG: hypothetical protein IJ068_07545 [Bacilli bacterium]|nr:hypothetical protein [Bacilli bacterium]